MISLVTSSFTRGSDKFYPAFLNICADNVANFFNGLGPKCLSFIVANLALGYISEATFKKDVLTYC